MSARNRAGAVSRAAACCKRAGTEKFVRGVSARREGHARHGRRATAPTPPALSARRARTRDKMR
eukprot:1656060-Prymnesium_polylepis.1